MSQKISELHCIVTGRVQGVAYRNFAQSIASDMSIKGFAANLPDGSVEILAQGEYGTLKTFRNHLQTGPIESKVSTIYDDWREPSKLFEGFTIM